MFIKNSNKPRDVRAIADEFSSSNDQKAKSFANYNYLLRLQIIDMC